VTRAGEAAEGQNGSSIVILILGLEGGFGTLCVQYIILYSI
jgi:hypothetical protein